MSGDQHDTLFTALSNSRRRIVIRELANGDCTIGELAEHVARVENDLPSARQVDSPDRKRVYISLHQSHLGKLDTWNVVEWDEQSGAVSTGHQHERALRVLDVAAEIEAEREASILQRVKGVVGGEV